MAGQKISARGSMNINRTKLYYDQLETKELCDCASCKNYYHEIKSTYPNLAAYLSTLGIDIEKPFEVMPLEPYEGYIEYSGVQYIVFGKSSEFKNMTISGVRIELADSHPTTDVDEEYFVIEIYPIRLKWVNGDYSE